MRTFLPVLLAWLWLFGSCSSDATTERPMEEQPDPGIASNYGVFLENNGNYSLQEISANALELDALGTLEVGAFSPPIFSDIEQSVLGVLLPGADCAVEVLRYSAQGSSQKDILSNLDACSVQVLGFAQSLSANYIIYSMEDPVTTEVTYSVRRMSVDGMEFIDKVLPGRAVDLDFAAGKLFVLAYLSETETESAVLEFPQDLTGDPVSHPVSIGGELLVSMGTDRILLGFEDAHQIYDASTMSLLDNIRYQTGTEPGFADEQPLSDAAGNLLYYLYDDPQTPAQEQIAAVYESDRRTLVLYLIENFLSPDQREFQYDVGAINAVGYDSANGILIIGYTKATTPTQGGLLRLKLEPEFQFIDQLDLPAVPQIIYTTQ